MRVIPAALPPRLMAADRGKLGPFRTRLLTPADLDAVAGLREEVLSQLEHPDLYVRESDEPAFLRAHLGEQGETIGVYDDDLLIAYAMLGLPDAHAEANLGRHLDLPARTTADVAHVASCMVRRAYRGHGLQRTLLVARFSLAQAHGRGVCIAMSSLHNHASRQNMLREGMRIAWVGQIEGLRRHLLALDLQRPWTFDLGNARRVPALDWDTQQALARQGWWGVGAVEGSSPGELWFARHRAEHQGAPA